MVDYETYSLVTVTRIESYTDIDGRRGKRIELAVVNPRIEHEDYSPESRIVKEVVTQLRTFGFPIVQRQQGNIKLVIYLLPEEEEAFGLEFKVNNIYKITFSNGVLKFEDVTREYRLVG